MVVTLGSKKEKNRVLQSQRNIDSMINNDSNFS